MPLPAGRGSRHTRLRLFCFPFAGGGATVYRSWQDKLPEEIEVRPICLPGREQRFGEAAFEAIDDAVAALFDAVHPMTTKPYAFFGYSMGGIIAHHLACRLMADGAPLPAHLFIAALRGPDMTATRRQLHSLPSDDFWSEVAAYGGTPAEILESREYRALFEPSLRADFKLAQTAFSGDLPQLRCPITAFGGANDSNPAPTDLDGWRQATTERFEKHIYPGGHFFMGQNEAPMLDLIKEKLRCTPVSDNQGSYSRTSSN